MKELTNDELNEHLMHLITSSQKSPVAPKLISQLKSVSQFNEIICKIITQILRITSPESPFTRSYVSKYIHKLADFPGHISVPMIDIIISYKIILLIDVKSFIKFLDKINVNYNFSKKLKLQNIDECEENNENNKPKKVKYIKLMKSAENSTLINNDYFDTNIMLEYVKRLIDLHIEESKNGKQIVLEVFKNISKNESKIYKYVIQREMFLEILEKFEDENEFICGFTALEIEWKVKLKPRYIKNKQLQKKYLFGLFEENKKLNHHNNKELQSGNIQHKEKNNVIDCTLYQQLYDLYKLESSRIFLVQNRKCCVLCSEIIEEFLVDSDRKIRARIFGFIPISRLNVLDASKDVRIIVFNRIRNYYENNHELMDKSVLLNLFKGVLTKVKDEFIECLMKLDLDFSIIYEIRNECGVKQFLKEQKKIVVGSKKNNNSIDNYLNKSNKSNEDASNKSKDIVDLEISEHDNNSNPNNTNSINFNSFVKRKIYDFLFLKNLKSESEKKFFLKYFLCNKFLKDELMELLEVTPYLSCLYFKTQGECEESYKYLLLDNSKNLKNIQQYREIIYFLASFIKEKFIIDYEKITDEYSFHFYSVFDEVNDEFLEKLCEIPDPEFYIIFFISKFSKKNSNVYKIVNQYLSKNKDNIYRLLDVLTHCKNKNILISQLEPILENQIDIKMAEIIRDRMSPCSLLIYFFLGGVVTLQNEVFFTETIKILIKGVKNTSQRAIMEKIRIIYSRFFENMENKRKNIFYSMVLKMRDMSTLGENENKYKFITDNFIDDNTLITDTSNSNVKVINKKDESIEQIDAQKNKKRIDVRSLSDGDKVLYMVCDIIKEILKGCSGIDIEQDFSFLYQINPIFIEMLRKEEFSIRIKDE